MRTPGQRCGFADYADLLRLIVDQPGTVQELSTRFGVSVDKLRLVLGAMTDAGLLLPLAWRQGASNGVHSCVYGFYGPPAPYPGLRSRARTRRRTDVTRFCALVWRLMCGPVSRADLAAWTGVHSNTLALAIERLQALRLIYVAEWQKHLRPGGRPAALFRFGINKPSKTRPPPKSKSDYWLAQKAVRKSRRDAADLLFMTAGKPRPKRATTTPPERTP